MALEPQDYRKTLQTHRRGTRANQPAANTCLDGTLYYVTDEQKTERANGGVWEDYTDGGGGTITNNYISYLLGAQDGQDGEDAPIIPGPAGATGATGATGPTGSIGPPGYDGLDGEDAPIVPGPQGIQGNQGIQGIQGPPGIDGLDGEDGLVIVGPTGATGPQGLQGPIGIPGNDGEDGDDTPYYKNTEPKTALLQFVSAASGGHAPADATTYIYGNQSSFNPGTTNTLIPVVCPIAGLIRRVSFSVVVAGTLASAGNSLFVINNVTTGVNSASASLAFTAVGNIVTIDVALQVNVGDLLQVAFLTPTWGTNPTIVLYTATAYLEGNY